MPSWRPESLETPGYSPWQERSRAMGEYWTKLSYFGFGVSIIATALAITPFAPWGNRDPATYICWSPIFVFLGMSLNMAVGVKIMLFNGKLSSAILASFGVLLPMLVLPIYAVYAVPYLLFSFLASLMFG